MSSARISIDDDAVQDLLREAGVRVNEQVQQGTEKSARALRDAIRTKVNRQGHGRIYQSGRGQSKHQASLPGEPPATDTGVYRNSWGAKPMPKGGPTPSGIQSGASLTPESISGISTPDTGAWMVFTPLKRGPWLEYGTDRMAPRPHARPAAQEHQEDHNRIMREAVEEGIKRAG